MSMHVGHKHDDTDKNAHVSYANRSNNPVRLNRREIRRLIIVLPMLVTGGVALLFSYIYSSLILTFIGLGLVFWGSVLYYITSTRYYPEELFRTVIEAYGKGMGDLLKRFGSDTSRSVAVVLFYPKQLRLGGLTQGYIFIHNGSGAKVHEGNTITLNPYLEVLNEHVGDGSSSSSSNNVSYDASRSLKPAQHIILKAPTQSLIDLFESRLDSNFALMSIDDLRINIERLFVEEFMIADNVEMSIDGDDTARVKINGKDTAMICTSMHAISTALCPVCSSIALALAKNTGKAVLIKDSKVGSKSINTVYSLLEMV